MRWRNPDKSLGCFINPYSEDSHHNLWDVILWRFGHYDEPHILPPPGFRYPAEPAPFDPSKPHAVWIGHSTFLIRIGSLSVLTDPHFTSHCSPVRVSALERRHEPAVLLKELPSIDIVLISHNHYDHLDEKSVWEILSRNPHVHWIVPYGVKRWFSKRKIQNVDELNWGESRIFSDARVTAVPAQHFSGRGLWDENCSLWCGFIVESQDKTFYFVGDTGYNSVDFKQISEHWPLIDLSMIPIGAYAPKRLMQTIHVCPKEAVQIHIDVHSRLSLGMHWNTFSLSDEPVDLPPYDLYLAMEEKKLPLESFIPISPGIQVNW